MASESPQVWRGPFCGADRLKFVGGVPRCMVCRAVFFVTFSRYARKSPNKAQPQGSAAHSSGEGAS